MTIQLLSINSGVVIPLIVSDPHVPGSFSKEFSAIQKQSVSHLGQTGGSAAVICGALGITGDEQADRSVHGGIDQAVYCYPFEHYEIWKRELSWLAALSNEALFGVVGENLSLRGIVEGDVFVGDQILIGQEVVLQVTKPREPCFKFNARMRSKHASKLMVQHNICGWYCRVINPGRIAAGDPVNIRAGAREIRVSVSVSHRPEVD